MYIFGLLFFGEFYPSRRDLSPCREREGKKIPKKEGQARKTNSRERKREDESTESSVQITKRRGEKVLDKHSPRSKSRETLFLFFLFGTFKYGNPRVFATVGILFMDRARAVTRFVMLTFLAQPGALVCPKGVVAGCGRETLKVPTSVT